MLVAWPGQQPLEDWQILLLLVVAGAGLTAIVFRLALRRARRDRSPDKRT